MRVISGMWRGRRLKSPSGMDIRPTTDRVKEALFSIIGPQLRGGWVVDLCCGSGGLGIEALSRGAARVIFVDASRQSLKYTRENLELCGAPTKDWELVPAEAVAWLQRWRPPGKDIPWLILADPPYRSDLTGGIVEAVGSVSADPGFILAAIEDDAISDFPQANGLKSEIRRYGKSQLLFLTRENPGRHGTEL
jgi:16S rRNA (guanine966-N2)-methyltransferase